MDYVCNYLYLENIDEVRYLAVLSLHVKICTVRLQRLKITIAI